MGAHGAGKLVAAKLSVQFSMFAGSKEQRPVTTDESNHIPYLGHRRIFRLRIHGRDRGLPQTNQNQERV
jgi:hypothetical protein